jgi:hypothetical protein
MEAGTDLRTIQLLAGGSKHRWFQDDRFHDLLVRGS